MQRHIFVVYCERIGRRKAYHLKFPYNEQLVQRIKDLPEDTRKWSARAMAWELTTYALFTIIKKYAKSKKIYFDFGNEETRKIFIKQVNEIKTKAIEKRKFIADLNIKKEEWVKYKQELEETYIKYSDKLHSLLKEGIKLYPHQIIAAMFMNVTRSTLISHEMGLGKTLSSILYVEMNDFEKVIVITPNSLKFNYYNEVLKFTNSTAHIVGWRKNTCGIEDAKYIILNYEFFNPSRSKSRKNDRFLNKWDKLDIDCIDAVISDESHRLKSSKSNTYKNYKRTFTKKIFRNEKVSKIFLSGTPAPNRAYELYTILNQISEVDFPNKKHFYSYYCGMEYNKEDGWGYDYNYLDTKFEELFHKIAPFTHRKRKSEVLKDLPDKIYQRILLEMSENEFLIYEEIERGVIGKYVKEVKPNPLTIMLSLRQYTSELKSKYIRELIDNILQSGEKIVIVDAFKESLYSLKDIYGDIAVLHTGDVSVEERSEMVKQFQDLNSNIKIFLASIQTANYGLTLTAASKVFLLTLPYSVGEYDQVADRCHRIGQKSVVNIYPLIFPDTIDDYVYSSIESKRKEIVKVMDNEDYKSNINESVLNDVINKIKEKYGE